MNDLKYIQYLVERFLDGLTTLDEEHEIESFIRANRGNLSSMPEDVQIVAEMFKQLQDMDRPSRIKRVTLLWRWAAAAVVAIAVAFGVLLYSHVPQQSPVRQSETVLIVKASRAVEVVESEALPHLTPAADEEAVAKVRTNERTGTRHKAKTQPIKTENTPVAPPSVTCAPMEMLPMADTEMPVMATPSPEVKGLMMECEMKMLEDQYQAYESRRRTIII